MNQHVTNQIKNELKVTDCQVFSIKKPQHEG